MDRIRQLVGRSFLRVAFLANAQLTAKMKKFLATFAATALLAGSTLGYTGLRFGPHMQAQGVQVLSIPRQLDRLVTDPIGIAAFHNVFAFPLFTLDGKTSAIELYDLSGDTIASFTVPPVLQGEFAYAVAGDPRTGILWVGTSTALLDFDVSSHSMHVFNLPPVARPYVAPGEFGPARVLGLAVDHADHLWITRDFDNSVTEFDPNSHQFRELPLPTGVVPSSIAILPDGIIATNVYHTDNPSYEWSGSNMDTGYILLDPETLKTTFRSGMTTTVWPAGSGEVGTIGRGRVDASEADSGASVRTFMLTSRSLNPGLAVSQADGSVWVAAGGAVDQFRDGEQEIYSIPARCGVLPIPARVKIPNGLGCFYPDAKSVAIAANGTVAIVLGGYNAIALARS